MAEEGDIEARRELPALGGVPEEGLEPPVEIGGKGGGGFLFNLVIFFERPLTRVLLKDFFSLKNIGFFLRFSPFFRFFLYDRPSSTPRLDGRGFCLVFFFFETASVKDWRGGGRSSLRPYRLQALDSCPPEFLSYQVDVKDVNGKKTGLGRETLRMLTLRGLQKQGVGQQ